MASNTKQKILEKASDLFSKKGYSNVGIREIAKAAGCSHTAIYQYFKSKNEILFECVKDSLILFQHTMEDINKSADTAEQKILQMSHAYVKFGFEHLNSYNLLFLYAGERLDSENLESPISKLRVQCFNILKQNIDKIFAYIDDEEIRLNIARGVFFFLHGFIGLYTSENAKYNSRLKKIINDYLNSTLLINKNV